MLKANSEIRRVIREKDEKIISGTTAVRQLLSEVQRQVTGHLGRAALGSWDAYILKEMLTAIEARMSEFEAAARKEASGLLDGMWGKGMELVSAPLAAGGIYTGFNISRSSLDVLAGWKDFTFTKIKGLSDSALDRIKSELTLGVLGGKTPQEVAKAIGMSLDEPTSVFTSIAARAEAITKTEMGRVFSLSAQKRMEEAAEYVEGLEKQWLHAGHPRIARPMHVAMHGIHVPVNEPFLVGNVAMMHPRDPKAPASEVINCGCDHVPYHENWYKAA